MLSDLISRLILYIRKSIVRGLVYTGLEKTQLHKIRQCNACRISCCNCCCICLTRIPVCTCIAMFFLALGFTGFSVGLYYGVEHLNVWLKMEVANLAKMGVLALGIFLGCMSGVGFLHGIAATGRTRFTVYRGWKSKCLGRCCILLILGWHALMWLLWTILAPLLIFPVIFLVIFFATCNVKLIKQVGKTCIEFKEYGIDDIVKMDRVCGYELEEFCKAIVPATPYFLASMVSGFFIVIGVFIMIIALVANLVHVHGHHPRARPSEWSTCKKCCFIENPEFYDDCFPEPEEEVVQLSFRQKIFEKKGDLDGKPNPHNTKEWKYVYDFHKEPKGVGKRY